MTTKPVTSQWALATFLACLSLTAAADWTVYQSKSYGFSMLVPAGTAVKEREWGGGWGGLNANHEGVKLYGLAKRGAAETDEAIEKFAVKEIGIPASAWTQVDKGTDKQGFKRYRTFQATQGSKLVFGGYGVGPKGNYLLYLETTPADFKEHRADYDKWYESIRVQ